MNCLHCGKPINDLATAEEMKHAWHRKCIAKFFGTKKFPEIDISDTILMQIALDSTKKGYTVPGVQRKISFNLAIDDNNPRLTLINYPTGFILKPQTQEYSHLPQAEYLVMQMANSTGIKTVPFGLVKIAAQDNNYAYITKRIDRVTNKYKQIQMLAMEDFCQLDGRLTQDKYRGSYERCAKLISKYSLYPGLDLSELLLRIVFSFVVGNSDMHLKNFSLIETSCNSHEYVLSDAYDMIPANIIIPQDTEQFALSMNGKKRNIKLKDFIVFAKSIGVPEKSAYKIIAKVVSMKNDYFSMCENSYMSQEMKKKLINIIGNRIEVINFR